MKYYCKIDSSIGALFLVSRRESLSGLYFEDGRQIPNFSEDYEERDDLEIFEKTRDWLDRYFKGERPEPGEFELDPETTDFRKEVLNKLLEIPYGEVKSYSEIGEEIDSSKGRLLSRAVAGWVANNPISIIIPCHRVVHRDGDYRGVVEETKGRYFS